MCIYLRKHINKFSIKILYNAQLGDLPMDYSFIDAMPMLPMLNPILMWTHSFFATEKRVMILSFFLLIVNLFRYCLIKANG